MRVFNLRERLKKPGESILGYDDTGSHACYLIYGLMAPREKNRLLKPGKGHEELFLVIKGEFQIYGSESIILKEGQAVHLQGEDSFYLENLQDEEGIYVIAGGHSEGGHH